MKYESEDIYCPNITSYLELSHMGHLQKHNDFHIVNLSEFGDKSKYEQKTPIIKVRSRKLGFFQIVTSSNHDANLTVDGTKYNSLKVDIIFIAPDQVVSFDVKSFKKGAVGYSLVFSSEFLNISPSNYSLLKNFPYFNVNRPPVYTLTEQQNNLFIDHMDKIYTCFNELDKDNLEIIRSYLTIMLFESNQMFIEGEVKSVANSRVEEVVYKFESLIMQTPSKRQKLDYYAQKLNFSSIYLAECIKKATGKTGKQIITEYLILEAKSLLNQSTKTINDISFQLGFSDTSNFVAFFKKNAGSTPNQFRSV
ncbi:MAG: AraC family transcriptional regulator [Crocinitomicaceae bacterium]|nr:AraC family transcriptional regulator [Crocinitomicaceae bacterium]